MAGSCMCALETSVPKGKVPLSSAGKSMAVSSVAKPTEEFSLVGDTSTDVPMAKTYITTS